MRTIKFRGKSLENGEWLYGDLIHYEWEPEQPYPYIQTGMERNEHGIMQTRGGRVNPSTIGQFTGLTDNNGKEIYEGDILLFCDSIKSEVKFHHGGFGYTTPSGNFLLGGNPNFDFNPDDKDERFEIIGNIYDNPELLEGGSNE